MAVQDFAYSATFFYDILARHAVIKNLNYPEVVEQKWWHSYGS